MKDLGDLEARITKVEKAARQAQSRAAIVAATLSILGSGGAVTLLQHYSGERLRAAEAALKEQEIRLKDRDSIDKQQLSKIEINLKKQQQESQDFDLKLNQHKAAVDALEKAIVVLRKSGASQNEVTILHERLKHEARDFSNWASQPSRYSLDQRDWPRSTVKLQGGSIKEPTFPPAKQEASDKSNKSTHYSKKDKVEHSDK